MAQLLLCILFGCVITCSSLPALSLAKQVKGTWVQTLYKQTKGKRLVKAKFSYSHKGICGREFFSYNKYGILVKHIVDNGSSHNKENLKGVTKRTISEITLHKKLPFFGLPLKIKEYSYDSKKKKNVFVKKAVHSYSRDGLLKKIAIYKADKKLNSTISYRPDKVAPPPPADRKSNVPSETTPTCRAERKVIELILTAEELEQVNQERNAPHPQTVQRRLDAIYLTATGKKRGEVAKLLGCSLDSVRNWIAIYKNDGIAGLTKRASRGGKLQ